MTNNDIRSKQRKDPSLRVDTHAHSPLERLVSHNETSCPSLPSLHHPEPLIGPQGIATMTLRQRHNLNLHLTILPHEELAAQLTLATRAGDARSA